MSLSANEIKRLIENPAVDPALFPLDPDVVFLNHGSFGSCPVAILEYQNELRLRLERQPIRFLVHELESLLDESRAAMANFVGAQADDLVLVANATSGVNTVLRSLTFEPGDELLVTDHEYNACRNALDYVAGRSGVKVVVAHVPFPIHSSDEVKDSVLAKVTDRTRLLLIDHITSPTALIFPVAEIIQALNQRGIDTLVDGAHAPGMIPLNLDELGAAFYTGNCHKWMCAPKGVGFLRVQRDRQRDIHPLTISHGANSQRKDRSKFQIEFGWTGTSDPTAAICLPRTIDFMGTLLPGGWPDIMRRNHELALAARRTICEVLDIPIPAPDEMIGSIASFPITDSTSSEPAKSPLHADSWQDELMANHRIEVPIHPWPELPKRLVRISAQLYNSSPQYELLARGIKDLIKPRVPVPG